VRQSAGLGDTARPPTSRTRSAWGSTRGTTSIWTTACCSARSRISTRCRSATRSSVMRSTSGWTGPSGIICGRATGPDASALHPREPVARPSQAERDPDEHPRGKAVMLPEELAAAAARVTHFLIEKRPADPSVMHETPDRDVHDPSAHGADAPAEIDVLVVQ